MSNAFLRFLFRFLLSYILKTQTRGQHYYNNITTVMYFVSVFTCTELHIDFLAQVTYPTKKGGRIRVFLKSGRPTNLRCCVVFFELWDGVSANIVTHLLPSLNCHLDQPLQPQTFEYPTTDFIKCMFDALLEKTWTTGKMWIKSNPWIWCGSIRCGHFIRGRTATIFSVSALKIRQKQIETC